MDYPGKVITKTQVTPTQTSASGNWTLDDQAAAIKNNNWPVALVPNPISKSLRFNSADSAYLNRTPGSAPTNADIGTWSFWIKRTKLGVEEYVFGSRDGTNVTLTGIRFISTDALEFLMFSGGSALARRITTQVFRDPSAWYHFVIVYNSPSATASERVRIYVNGVEITAFSTSVNPSQNQDLIRWAANGIPNYIGNEGTTLGNYGDYYLTETYYIDGQALTPSSFGMTNPQTGQWIPLKYTGTYGTNGFYLNFKDATSTTTLGYDYSGNANNWTTNNFSVTAGVGNDSLTDVPTPWFAYNTTGDVGGVVRGNYCTWNPLDKNTNVTINNGNLDAIYTGTADVYGCFSTFSVSSGKWYAEFTATGLGGSSYPLVGIRRSSNYSASFLPETLVNLKAGTSDNRGSAGPTFTAFVDGDVLGIAFNADSGEIFFSKNGTFLNSGNPVAGTGEFFSGLTDGPFKFGIGTYSSRTATANFGQRPFAYTPPTGFRSLCTTNLPATAIGFGLTNQGDDYFNAVLYTGDGIANRSVTGVGFQPDLVWIKSRSNVTNHKLLDSVRGAGWALSSDLTNADIATSNFSFLSDGFSVPAGTNFNSSGYTYVGWNWKASGSTVSNTAGTITSTLSANTTAGFSIVTYTGTGSAATVGHGLGVAPNMIIVKNRTNAGQFWAVGHSSLTSWANGVYLNSDAAQASATTLFNSTAPTSTVFSVGTSGDTNGSTHNMVAYCFDAVPGYSAFGSYVGNGSTDGPFVYTGFRPRWIMFKGVSSGLLEHWYVYDAARNTYNVLDLELNPNNSGAEATFTTLDFVSNGFKIRNTNSLSNQSSATYIYACFAEFPFQFANAR